MVGWLPKVHRAGHVCRAAVVLGARVEQQHGVSADGAVGAGDGAVVDDGAVGPRAGDGGEGLLDEPLLLPAHLDQLQPHLRLGDGAAGGHLSLQPGEELGHRRAVPQVRLPHPRQLSFVLQRLGQSQRGLAFEHPHRCRLSRRLHPSLLLAGLLGLGLGLCLNRLLCLLGRRLGRGVGRLRLRRARAGVVCAHHHQRRRLPPVRARRRRQHAHLARRVPELAAGLVERLPQALDGDDAQRALRNGHDALRALLGGEGGGVLQQLVRERRQDEAPRVQVPEPRPRRQRQHRLLPADRGGEELGRARAEEAGAGVGELAGDAVHLRAEEHAVLQADVEEERRGLRHARVRLLLALADARVQHQQRLGRRRHRLRREHRQAVVRVQRQDPHRVVEAPHSEELRPLAALGDG
mmetsp:Transcript_11543/g.24167  ORF Transcript_11543/g.24167 Transcript_11543/m.24167 type:complete len:408 (-) Transcript_11543:1938-3161(-)